MVFTCGFKYLLTCVDAFSKYTWVFPLQLKFDVIHTLRHFITVAETLFSTKVKVVQTDGGGEFKALTSLFLTKKNCTQVGWFSYTPSEWLG